MKTNKLIIIFFVLLFAYSCNQQKKSAKQISWIRFEWEGDSIGNRYFDKLALFVPFQMEGIPYKFSSQLDLGAPITMVYGNSLNPLLNEFPEIFQKLDTTYKKHVIQGKKVDVFKNISFYLDTLKFTHQNIAYFKGFGEKYAMNDFRKDSLLHIGTIGSDLFKEKVLIIDFKKQRLAILDSLSSDLENEMLDIIIENGRLKIPVNINGKNVYVLYDTGTSFATLFLSTQNWNAYRDTTSKLDTIMATAWGTEYPLFISKTNIEIKMGNSIFKPETIMANNLEPYYDFYKKMNIIGLMGNKLFYNKMILIDFKNKKFGMINNQQLTRHIHNGG
jgi:hypothetical protein